MAKISIYATQKGGLKVLSEAPSITSSITLVAPDGTVLNLFLPVEQLALLRQLPKAVGHFFVSDSDLNFIDDHTLADKAAMAFYAGNAQPENDANNPNNIASLSEEAQRMVGLLVSNSSGRPTLKSSTFFLLLQEYNGETFAHERLFSTLDDVVASDDFGVTPATVLKISDDVPFVDVTEAACRLWDDKFGQEFFHEHEGLPEFICDTLPDALDFYRDQQAEDDRERKSGGWVSGYGSVI